MRASRPSLAGVGLSVLVHLCFAGVLTTLPSVDETLASARVERYRVELEAFSGQGRQPPGVESSRATFERVRPRPGGVVSRQNIDSDDRGERGDVTGALRGIRLAARAHDILLFDSPLNNLERGQTQRIRTSRSRATREVRRATPNPEEAAFLASGTGPHQERRPVSARDADQGARRARPRVVRGGAVSPTTVNEDGSGPRPSRNASPADGAATRGADIPSPGVGILDGRGRRRVPSANVARGRPPVDQGPAATNARARDGRVRDDTDAELLAGHLMASWTEATRRTAPRAGDGRGGVGGGGAPGVGGGRREGGRAAVHSPGDGRDAALDTSDSRYRRWFLSARRRVHEALRYPEARARALDQGTVIYSVWLRRDGSLVRAPALVRTSGFDDMDAAALTAIRRATPFSPIPPDLAPRLDPVPVRIPIDFSNPMVH